MCVRVCVHVCVCVCTLLFSVLLFLVSLEDLLSLFLKKEKLSLFSVGEQRKLVLSPSKKFLHCLHMAWIT